MSIWNAADLGFMTILVLSVGISVWRGFVKEVLILVSGILSLYLAYAYGASVGEYCTFLSSVVLRKTCGYALVFIVASLVTTGIKIVLLKFIKVNNFQFIDRLGGFLFGFLRASFAASILVSVLHTTPIVKQPWWEDSAMIPYIEETSKKTIAMLPKEWKDQVFAFIDKFNLEYV